MKRTLILTLTAALALVPEGQAFASVRKNLDDLAVINPEEKTVAVFESASKKSEIIGELDGGQVVTIQKIKKKTNKKNKTKVWYQISYGEDGEKGYVRPEDLFCRWKAQEYLIGEQLLYVTSLGEESTPVYMNADSEGIVAFQLLSDEVYELLDANNQYAMISADNFIGFASSDEIAYIIKDWEDEPREELVKMALSYLGYPYVWAGEDLENGVDCSGFTMKIYEAFGVSLPHSSRQQAAMGKEVKSFEDLKAGDLIFYGNSSGTVNHVSIYIGDGLVVHASNEKSGIKISDWDYRTPVTMRTFSGINME
ncbi:MAG: C40 family peptidase [Clostridiales bacterium]|nr:C40 family peptidase [Clostridiales bacterium]